MVDNKSAIQPNTTPILFVNFSDKDFELKWDGQTQRLLKSKESTWLPFWLAEHAAKHLVDREMNEKKIPTDHFSRESYTAKCIGNKPDQKAANNDPLGLDILNKNMQSKEVKEGFVKEITEEKTEKKAKGRSKKTVTEEDSFEG